MPPEIAPVEVPEGWFALIEALQRNRVQFVIAGSAADAIVESAPDTAARLVIAPAPYRRNLERVTVALGAMDLRLRNSDGPSNPLPAQRLVDHPALRWPLIASGTELDLIGSAVGDGEFSIRVWRTRPVQLTCGDRTVTAEVELLATRVTA